MGKIAGERVLCRAHPRFPFTIIRPPVVSGPADPTLRAYYFIQRLLDGGEVLLPRGDYHFRQVYSEDLAGAFLAVLGNVRCLGKAYNVASREIVSLRQHVESIAAGLGAAPRIVEIPHPLFEGRGFLSDFPSYHGPRPLFPCIVPDIARAEAELDFRPTPYGEWMALTAGWFAQAYRGPASAGYPRRQEEIRLAREYREQEAKFLSRF
ncbi:MAG: hypothetical protein HYZ68_04385 [Chloroflexi bacterium]|nr:hypothetical protein [Chloroflexota bacterium]